MATLPSTTARLARGYQSNTRRLWEACEQSLLKIPALRQHLGKRFSYPPRFSARIVTAMLDVIGGRKERIRAAVLFAEARKISAQVDERPCHHMNDAVLALQRAPHAKEARGQHRAAITLEGLRPGRVSPAVAS